MSNLNGGNGTVNNSSANNGNNNILDSFSSITNFDAGSNDHMNMNMQARQGLLSQQLFNFEKNGKSLDLDTLDTANISLNENSKLQSGGDKSRRLYDLDEQNISSLNSSNLANFVRDNVVVHHSDINSLGSREARHSSNSREKDNQQRDRCETPDIVKGIQEQLLADEM